MGTNDENTSWQVSLIQGSPKCVGSAKEGAPKFAQQDTGSPGEDVTPFLVLQS